MSHSISVVRDNNQSPATIAVGTKPGTPLAEAEALARPLLEEGETLELASYSPRRGHYHWTVKLPEPPRWQFGDLCLQAFEDGVHLLWRRNYDGHWARAGSVMLLTDREVEEALASNSRIIRWTILRQRGQNLTVTSS